MNEYDRKKQGQQFEGYAFTFCKAGLLVLIFRNYSLLALSGLSALFYILAWIRGIREYRCWAKPPWITAFWLAVFAGQLAILIYKPASIPALIRHVLHGFGITGG
jgi:hypothetical protein